MENLMLIQTIVLILTGLIVLWYTVETFKLRKQNYEELKLSSISRIHERINCQRNINTRRYIYREFEFIHKNVIRQSFGEDYIKVENNIEKANISKLLKDIVPNEQTLKKYTDALARKDAGTTGFSMLDAIELLIGDFELIAFPYSIGISSIQDIIDLYKPIIERAAPFLLPYVAIQKKLRGDTKNIYKRQYLYMLSELRIIEKCETFYHYLEI